MTFHDVVLIYVLFLLGNIGVPLRRRDITVGVQHIAEPRLLAPPAISNTPNAFDEKHTILND